MSKIKNFIDLNNSLDPIPHIGVVGDLMIDEYYQVEVNRISPEFPIPVYLSNSDKPISVAPGGAANVAQQLVNFNVHTYLYGFQDKRYQKTFPKSHIRGHAEYVNLVPRKMRLYNKNHPLVRWDIETDSYGTSEKKLHKIYHQLLEDFNKTDIKVAILSDYNKGFWNIEERASAWMKNKITIVDPKNDFEKWYGCTIFKPNSVEAKKLSGLSEWKDQAEFFENNLNCRAVLITNEGNGVRGIINGKYFNLHVPEYKKVNAVSTIGAGDCFVAVLAACLSRDMSIEDATEVAFAAGSVYVQKKFNEPVSPSEILQTEGEIKNKLVDSSFLMNRSCSLCFTNGCFDLLHEGHLSLLKFAKQTADKLVVAINSDDSVKKLKGVGRPINDLNSRINMLSMLDFVDYVVVFGDDTPYNIIKQIKPEVLVKGGDYSKDTIVGSDLVKDVRICPLKKGKSTTNIIDKILKNEKIKQETN